jgi:hypothetical protein
VSLVVGVSYNGFFSMFSDKGLFLNESIRIIDSAEKVVRRDGSCIGSVGTLENVVDLESESQEMLDFLEILRNRELNKRWRYQSRQKIRNIVVSIPKGIEILYSDSIGLIYFDSSLSPADSGPVFAIGHGREVAIGALCMGVKSLYMSKKVKQEDLDCLTMESLKIGCHYNHFTHIGKRF